MKILHLTDLHLQTPPRVRDLFGKRLIGSANLYLLGRRARFSAAAQRAAIDAAMAEHPDVVVITGDLTAQALDAEFSAARTLLAPLLDHIPTVIIAGNHDSYVVEHPPMARMRQVFGPWMGPSSPWIHQHQGVAFLTLETCRAHPLSSGRVAPTDVERARDLLENCDASFVFLCIHYPLRGPEGQPYGPPTRAISNPQVIEEWLASSRRIGAVLHGHAHHGFQTTLRTAGGDIPILNPGAAGYAWLPDHKRTAHLNVYEVDDGRITDIRRLAYDGTRFLPEPGGAYASGR